MDRIQDLNEKSTNHEEERKNKEMEEMLDNPLTALYNHQHPEVLKNAKEFHYGNDKEE